MLAELPVSVQTPNQIGCSSSCLLDLAFPCSEYCLLMRVLISRRCLHCLSSNVSGKGSLAQKKSFRRKSQSANGLGFNWTAGLAAVARDRAAPKETYVKRSSTTLGIQIHPWDLIAVERDLEACERQ
jgi:hypothetical protein